VIGPAQAEEVVPRRERVARAAAWCREVLAEPVLAAVFPPRCVCCGEFETFLCARCRDSLRPAGPERCARCGHPGIGPGGPGWCPMCAGHEPTFTSARSAFLHDGPARRLVTAFKYDGLKVLGGVMAELAAPEFRALLASLGPVVVTWVPTHASNRRTRGYNQAEILARELARVAGEVPVSPLVRKVGRTVHQRGLDRQGRSHNLRGAFVAERAAGERVFEQIRGTVPMEQIRGAVSTGPTLGRRTIGDRGRDLKGVVLVDDVYTTGATVAEVSRAIVASWQVPVHVFTFGRTPADLPQRAD